VTPPGVEYFASPPSPGKGGNVTMFTRALFLDALSLLCACGALPAPSEGITLVRATPDAILLSGSCGGASLRIVELQPQEAALPANFGAVVATVVARSNFSSRLPRFDGSRDRLFSSFLALQEGPAGQTFNGGRPG